MDSNISIITALTAGVLSFASPCVLPLLSSYLFFISGSGAQNAGIKHRLATTLFFVLGFSVVFILLSVLLYGVFMFVGAFTKALNIIAGLVVVLLGVNIIFPFIPFLKYDDRSERCETCAPKHSVLAARRGSPLHPESRPRSGAGSFIVGLAFGATWTPCVGAFLGSVLLMASQSGAMAEAVFYLAVYSVGFGLPFLLASLFWGALMNALAKLRRAMPVIRIVSGVFLVSAGALMLAGKFPLINALLNGALNSAPL
ncbi:MAG: cytochrome c biogenesis CcdA family protein [Spirochaetaceae bacterium]|jgi:cytochrome c-type biogenesis protein|nr:cytochrome c biogenesis CcdA family protein [Spirochaetaceae bacterium]